MNQGEQDRQRLLEALCQRADLRTLGEVIGGIVHELNNALSVANGNVELLLDKMQSFSAEGSPVEPAGDLLAGGGAGVVDLLRDARTAAKWTATSTDVARRLEAFSHRLREERRLLPVGELVRESAEMIRYRCERESILLIFEGDAESTVEGRFGELQQALLSLIQNSREAIASTREEGEGEGNVIRISVESDDHRVQISVTDDGPGIPPGVGDSVFDPFYTTATKRTTTARGLGLTLSRAVAERHGGTLAFAPTEAGACAVLELPLAAG